MRCAAFVLLAFALSFDYAVADERIDKGARVRVSTAEGDRITGRVDELTADWLRIAPDGESAGVSVPLVEIEKLEVSRGRRSHGQGAWAKAKWGALIGAVPGAISLGAQHEQVGENGSSVGEAAALGAWSGAIFGGLIGAAIGALHPGEAWEKVSPTFRIAPTGPGSPGFSIAVTFGF